MIGCLTHHFIRFLGRKPIVNSSVKKRAGVMIIVKFGRQNFDHFIEVLKSSSSNRDLKLVICSRYQMFKIEDFAVSLS